MEWDKIVAKITPHIVKIETQTGSGTGFLSLYNEDKTLCGVATAWHVVRQADDWQQPIRLWNHSQSETVFLKANERFISKDWHTDSAVILFPAVLLPLPKDPISLLPSDFVINIGVEVGWLGFPALAPRDLCFFSGKISTPQESRKAYLIDGVAINGVSGGPVIHGSDAEGTQIVGTVSAYYPNRATGEVLPGLLSAQDLSYAHNVASQVQSIDEANKKQAELEASQKNETEFDGSEGSTNSDVENAE
jgi:hypothetical protein